MKPSPTAHALVSAAEQLFAEHGLGVSLRQIQDAAGVKNLSAINYHFGSRDALLSAVFERRMADVNPRRIAIMERLEREGLLDDPRALVGAMIHPLLPELEPRAGGNHYLRFLEQYLRARPQPDGADAPGEVTQGWLWMDAELVRLMTPLGETMIAIRMRFARLQAIAGLASIEARQMDGALPPQERDLFVEALTDAITAMLMSPIAPATAAHLRP